MGWMTGVRAMVMASAVMGVSACSLNTPYPDRALFTINVGDPEGATTQAASARHPDATLRVRRIQAVAPYGGTAFVYRTGSHQVTTDYYDAFAAAPADLVTGELVRWLRESRAFTAVVDGNAGIEHQLALEGRLQELSVETASPGGPTAVVTLEFVLLDEREAAPRVVLERTYTERVQVKGSDGKMAAAGWSEACRKIFGRLLADVK